MNAAHDVVEWVDDDLAQQVVVGEYSTHPTQLIVPVADLLTTFLQSVEGNGTSYIVDGHDIAEIITQIFEVLLNGGPNTLVDLQALPKFNRMLRPDDISPYMQQSIQQACQQMSRGIFDRMLALGGWKHGGFPYVFARFLGKDVVLDHIPY